MKDTQCNYYMYWYTYCMLWPIDLVQLTWSLHVTNVVVSGLSSSVHFTFWLHEEFIACCDLYLHSADYFNQSPTKSVVNSENKILSKMVATANGSECAPNVWAAQLVWKAHLWVLVKVLKKLESNNSLITKLQPLGLLWMLRHLVKWHPGVAEQFIWKHIR